jgi:hypothetical protein
MRALGRDAQTAERAYVTGGATAVLLGWRPATIDVDLKLVPEDEGVLRVIPRLKEELQVHVEFTSPLDFVPVPPGWEERSLFIAQEGRVTYSHFDPYPQCLAKLERSHAHGFRRAVEETFGEALRSNPPSYETVPSAATTSSATCRGVGNCATVSTPPAGAGPGPRPPSALPGDAAAPSARTCPTTCSRSPGWRR